MFAKEHICQKSTEQRQGVVDHAGLCRTNLAYCFVPEEEGRKRGKDADIEDGKNRFQIKMYWRDSGKFPEIERE